MKIFIKALYSLSLAIVFCAGRIWEALVFGGILFIFLMIPERKKEDKTKKTAQKPNLWLPGIFFILITITVINAIGRQSNALIVIIAYITLLILLTRGVLQKD